MNEESANPTPTHASETHASEAPAPETPAPETSAPEKNASEKKKIDILVRAKEFADRIPAKWFPTDAAGPRRCIDWRVALGLLVAAWLFRLSLVPQAVAVILLGLGAFYIAAAVVRKAVGPKAPVAPVAVGVLALCAVVCPGSFRTGVGASAELAAAADQAREAIATAGGPIGAVPAKQSAKEVAKARKESEKMILDFVKAASKGDFKKCEKLVYRGDSEAMLLWDGCKQEIEQGQALDDPTTATSLYLSANIVPFHHEIIDKKLEEMTESLTADPAQASKGTVFVPFKVSSKKSPDNGNACVFAFFTLLDGNSRKVSPVPVNVCYVSDLP